MAIDEVRPKHVNDLVSRLRSRGKLAPKTIYNIYGCLKALFRDAVIADLIDRSPCILSKYQLGENTDADPEWRSTAVYSRDELELMISDARIPWDRRVFYALQGIGGMRHGEAAGLRWRHWEATLQPLGRLTVAHSYDKQTKTKRTRWMPVHPTLSAILAEWKMAGWPQMMGRTPDPDDLIVPMPQGVRIPLGRMRDKNNSWKRVSDDLESLGLRHRRGHDLRRTLISLATNDGARKDLLELCTHTPSRRAAIDVYMNMPWDACCVEVAKLKVRRREPAEVVVLARPQAVGAEHDAVGGDASDDDGDGEAEEGSQAVLLATPLATPGGKEMEMQKVTGWRRRESKAAEPRVLPYAPVSLHTNASGKRPGRGLVAVLSRGPSRPGAVVV